MGSFRPFDGFRVYDGLNDRWITLTDEMAENFQAEVRTWSDGKVDWDGHVLEGGCRPLSPSLDRIEGEPSKEGRHQQSYTPQSPPTAALTAGWVRVARNIMGKIIVRLHRLNGAAHNLVPLSSAMCKTWPLTSC